MLKPRNNDAGLSLVEMVVAMVLAGIVGSLLLAWFVGASDTSTATTNSDLAAADARGTLQSWARYLQVAGSPTGGTGAGRIESLDADSIAFNARLANDPSCTTDAACDPLATTPVTLQLDPITGALSEIVGDTKNVLIARGVAAGDGSTGACLFTAYSDGAPLGCHPSPSDLEDVTAVTITFTITPKTGHPRTYTTSASFTTYVVPEG